MNKMTKELWVWLIAGILTFVFGCLTSIYGYYFLIGRINGSIKVCMLLLMGCAISVITCIVLTVKNIKKYK